MRALVIYACLVVACNLAGIFVGSFIERHTSPELGLIVILGMFFASLVVSWIATVFVMDGSLNNFYAGREQTEVERKGREYMNRSNTTA
jgi:CDP-diglyceride synthetase